MAIFPTLRNTTPMPRRRSRSPRDGWDRHPRRQSARLVRADDRRCRRQGPVAVSKARSWCQRAGHCSQRVQRKDGGVKRDTPLENHPELNEQGIPYRNSAKRSSVAEAHRRALERREKERVHEGGAGTRHGAESRGWPADLADTRWYYRGRDTGQPPDADPAAALAGVAAGAANAAAPAHDEGGGREPRFADPRRAAAAPGRSRADAVAIADRP
jgi:hypothetical protein